MIPVGEIAIAVFSNLIAAGIGYAIRIAVENRRRLRLLCATRVKRDEPVRVSAAYLFRIMVAGKYLLVRGGRIKDQYQPVGGVYKSFPSSKDTFDALSVCSDNSLQSSATDADDLRVRLPRKNLLRFVDWFDGRTGREVDLYREFREELEPLGVLGSDDRAAFNPSFVRSCDRKLTFSKQLSMNELLIHDVYEVELTETSENAVLEYAKAHPGGELVLVDAEDISRGSFNTQGNFFNIAPTAEKVM